MRRVLMNGADRRVFVAAVEQPDRRVIARRMSHRRVLVDPRQDALALLEQLVEALQPERMGAVGIVREPFAQRLRIERRLGAIDGGAPQARRFARDRVGALRIGQVVMIGEPE